MERVRVKYVERYDMELGIEVGDVGTVQPAHERATIVKVLFDKRQGIFIAMEREQLEVITDGKV